MATVALPEFPTGVDLEDYVAAFLQCAGFYTEKSLIESGETTIMELDIMAWKPTVDNTQHALFEVKGGDWGFADIFKVYGWKTYLEPRGVKAAYFVAPQAARSDKAVAYIEDKCTEIGLTLITHTDLDSLEGRFGELGLLPHSVNPDAHATWRFSFWLERQMQKVVGDRRKDRRGDQGPNAIWAYQELIRHGFLQARALRERLASMYQAHFDHPMLAKAVAAELDGNRWDTRSPSSGRHWQEALYKSKHTLVQASMYHEHRAKLAILKGAIEYTLLKQQGALPQESIVRFLGVELPADFLPDTFHNAVLGLESIEGFEKVASLWQSFLWKWGGFFLVDYETEELSALANEVGMTVSAASSAMGIYDILFPIQNGWFYSGQGSKILKLFPCQFRGIGAYYRREMRGAADMREAFGSLPYQHLVSNLAQWNNSAVSLLQYGMPNATGAS